MATQDQMSETLLPALDKRPRRFCKKSFPSSCLHHGMFFISRSSVIFLFSLTYIVQVLLSCLDRIVLASPRCTCSLRKGFICSTYSALLIVRISFNSTTFHELPAVLVCQGARFGDATASPSTLNPPNPLALHANP